VLIGICGLNIIMFVSANAYYMWRNGQRDQMWNGVSLSEKEEYLSTTG